MYTAFLQYSIYLGLSYATFLLATVSQVRLGMVLILLGWLGYIAADTYKDYSNQRQLNKKGMIKAIAGNVSQLLFFCLAVFVGFYIAVLSR